MMKQLADVGDRAAARPEPEQASALQLALLESRQRWRQFGALAADVLFETDAGGRITFASPDVILGWPADALLGQPGTVLLHDACGPDPFGFTVPIRRRHTWMRTLQGAPVCMALTCVPIRDASGRHCGTRGVAVNVTVQEQADATTASALRRGAALDHIMDGMRQEIMAPQMMQAILDGVTRALGTDGAMVVDLMAEGPERLLHRAGQDPFFVLAEMEPALDPALDTTRTFKLADARQVMACPASTRFGQQTALLVWRGYGARPWDVDDLALANSVTAVVRLALEHASIQREMARQARTDPLTGLLNRRAFMEEATRRLDRLRSEEMSAAVLFIDLDGLKQLNDRSGHEAGDAALMLTSALLRRTFRPADLVARLGGDEFACWLDGADSLSAAERAEGLRLTAPEEFAHLTAGQEDRMGMSIGIAAYAPGTGETLDQLLQRADQAMYQVKRSGRGHWLVSNVRWQG